MQSSLAVLLSVRNDWSLRGKSGSGGNTLKMMRVCVLVVAVDTEGKGHMKEGFCEGRNHRAWQLSQ